MPLHFVLLLCLVTPLVLLIQAFRSAIARIGGLLHLMQQIQLHFAPGLAVWILLFNKAQRPTNARQLALAQQIFLGPSNGFWSYEKKKKKEQDGESQHTKLKQSGNK